MKRRTLAALSALGLIVVGASALTLSLRGLSPIGARGLVLNTFTSANNPKASAVVEVRGDATPATAGAAAADVGTNAYA
jgi:hypothetical protein